MNEKFKKGDRVIVNDKLDMNPKFGVQVGMTGTVNEDDEWNPFVKMDEPKANYTDLGTAIPDDCLDLIE